MISLMTILILNLVIPPTEFKPQTYEGYEFPFGFSNDSSFTDQIRENANEVSSGMSLCYLYAIGIVNAGKYEAALNDSLLACMVLT